MKFIPSVEQTVEAVTSSPARIISMAPNLTEILYALGLEERIMAVTKYSNYPPSAEAKPKIGTFWYPNIEAIVTSKPDLVVTLDFPQQHQLSTRLNRIGCSCLTVNIDTIDELLEAIGNIGAVTNTTSQAEAIVSDITSRIEAVTDRISDREKPSVLWVVQRNPLRVAGTDTFVNEIIELAGGKNAVPPTLQKYPPIGLEQLMVCAPDVIIEPAMLTADIEKQQADAMEYWSRFEKIPAVNNQRILVISGDTVSRLGPRLPDGVRTVAEFIIPEFFNE